MENIEDVSNLFLETEKNESTPKQKSLKQNYTPRQIGSIVKYINPVQGGAYLPSVAEIFNADKKLHAIPVEEHGVVIGMIDRVTVTSETDSSLKRITLKNAKKYVTVSTEMIMLDANDFIERDLQKVTEINETYGLSDFPVFDSKAANRKFLGIANLNDILNRIAEIREQDLQKASIVQESLFPQKEYLEKLPYKVTAWNRMANSLGGDIYQALRVNDEESFVGIFDVSGKNAAASLITIAIASFFRINENNQAFATKPAYFVSTLDKYLTSIVPEGTFITSVICYFNTKQNVVYIYNCGHTVAYLTYNSPDEPVKTADVTPKLQPLGIGIVSENLSRKYDKADRPFAVLKYQSKIHLCLYSDGLTDMYNKEFEIFDEERAKNFFISLHSEVDEKVEDRIKQLVTNFTDETVIPDDITIVDIRL